MTGCKHWDSVSPIPSRSIRVLAHNGASMAVYGCVKSVKTVHGSGYTWDLHRERLQEVVGTHTPWSAGSVPTERW